MDRTAESSRDRGGNLASRSRVARLRLPDIRGHGAEDRLTSGRTAPDSAGQSAGLEGRTPRREPISSCLTDSVTYQLSAARPGAGTHRVDHDAGHDVRRSSLSPAHDGYG